MANAAGECFTTCRRAEILQQVRAGDVFDSKAVATTAPTDGLNKMALSQTARARENDVVLAPNELSGAQLLEFGAVDRAPIEFPIEVFERCHRGEVGVLYPPRDTPFVSRVRGYRQESLQQAQSGQFFLLRRGNDFIELLRVQRGF